MATNQNSNKESGAGTTKSGAKKTTRSATGTRSTTGTRSAAETKTAASKTAGTKTASARGTTKSAGTTRGSSSAAGRKTSSTARTSVGTRTTSKTASATKTSATKTASRSTAKASAVKASAAAAATATTVAKEPVDIFASTPYSSTATGASTPKTDASFASASRSTFSDDVASYLGGSKTVKSEAAPEKSSAAESDFGSSYTASSSYAGSKYSSGDESYSPSVSHGDDEIGSSANGNGGDRRNDDSEEKKEKKSKVLPIIFIASGVALMGGIGASVAINSKKSAPNATTYDALREESKANRENTISLASQYIERGDYDQAIAILNSYLSENPGDEEARSLLERAQLLKMGADNPELLSNDILANFNSYISSGDYDEAAAYVRSKTDDELADQGLDGSSLINKAETLSQGRDLLNQGEYGQAGNLLEDYLKTNPRDADVENMLAQVRRLASITGQDLGETDLAELNRILSSSDAGMANSSGDLASMNNGAAASRTPYFGITIKTDDSENVNKNVGELNVPGGNNSNVYEQKPVANQIEDSNSSVKPREEFISSMLSGSASGTNPSVTVANNATNDSGNSGSTSGSTTSTTKPATSTSGATGSTSGSATSTTKPATSTSGTAGSANGSTTSTTKPATSTSGTAGSTSGSATSTTKPATSTTGATGSTSGSTTSTTKPATSTSGSSATTSPSATRTSAASTATPSSSASLNPARGSSDVSGLSALAAAQVAKDTALKNVEDGTSTSPELLLRRYGTKAISRNDALEVGKNFIDDGKYDECINLMKELLTIDPNDSEARRLLNEAMEQKRKNGGTGGARTTDQNLALAEKWINGGNYDDAITLLNSILKKDPNNQKAKDLLEKALNAKNGNKNQLSESEKADKLAQALKLMNEGKYDEAKALLNEILAGNPDDPQAKNLLNQVNQKKAQNDADIAAKLQKARDAISSGDYETAMTLLNDILKNDPDNTVAKSLLAQAKARSAQAEKEKKDLLDKAKANLANGNPDDAIAALEKYLAENPNDEEAKKLLEQAKKDKANADKAYADKLAEAKRLMENGEYDKAAEILKQLAKENPSDPAVNELLKKVNDAEAADKLALAKEALKNGDYDKAAALLNEILKNDPNNAEAKRLLSQVNEDKAQAEKDRQLKLAQARSLINSGDYDKAEELLKDILKNNPDDAQAKSLLAQLQTKKAAAEKDKQNKLAQAKNDINSGDYDKAIAALNEILKNDPNNAEAKKLLADAQAKKNAAAQDAKLAQAKKDIDSGNYDKAIAALNEILKNDPNNAEAKKLLADAQAKKNAAAQDAKLAQAKKDIDGGNYDKAIAALNEILKNDPNNAEAKKLLADAQAKKNAAAQDAKLAQAKKDIDSGNYDKAIAALNEILKNDPNNAEAKKLLADAQAKKQAAEDAAAKAKDRTAKLAQARSMLNSGDYDGAIDVLNQLLKDDPNDAQAKNLLTQAQTKKAAADKDRANKLAKARTDIDSGNYDSAITAMNGLLKTNPNDADAKKLLDEATAKKNAAAKDRENKLAQAQKLIAAGDYDGAVAILNGLLGDNAKDGEAINLLNKANSEKAAAQAAAEETAKKANLEAVKQKVDSEITQGKASIAKGNATDALSHFNTAKGLLPQLDDAYAAEKLGDMAKSLYDAAQNASDATTKAALNNAAAQYAAEAAAKNPVNAPAHYVLGMQAMDARNYAKAEQELSLATKQDPTNGIYWYQLGRAQAMQQKYTAAATSFQNAIKYEPNLASAYYNLGYVQEKSGNVKSAIDSYKAAYNVDTNYERAYIAAGRLMANTGDYNGAVAAFGNAIKVNPSNSQTYQEQGAAYANMGDYKSAESSFRRALAYMDQSKPDAATYYNLSSVLSEQNKNSEGVNYAALAYNNKSSVSKPLQVNIIYNYGLLSEKTGEKKRAVSLYEEAITLDPTHLKTKINLGALYLENGDTDSAIMFLNSAYNQDPSNFEVNNNLGNAYREKGDFGKAVTYYQNALKISPTDNTVRENLAKAYASAGQYSNAKMTYEDVIAANNENWAAYLELAKIDMSLGDTQEAIQMLEYLQLHNPSYARSEVSTLLYSLR